MVRLKKQKSWKYLFIGILLALGAPIGWFLISQDRSQTGLYAYLWISTTTVFGIFGFWAGSLMDNLKKASEVDVLTGLLNHSTFLLFTEKWNIYCDRHQQSQATIMMDIDKFKSVNDEFSHLFGNFVIQEVGKLLQSEFRSSDVVARFGGDEFAVYLPDTTGRQAKAISDRILQKISQRKFILDDQQAQITMSMGIHETQKEPESVSNMLEKADLALYFSKQTGRNRSTIFSEIPKGSEILQRV